jgi:hypothetical protein
LRLAAIVLSLVIAMLASIPSTADASTVGCRIGHYSPALDDKQFPTIHRLRATNLPRLTSDYAPRCLVAESLAGLVKDGVARAAQRHGDDFRFDEHAPKSVRPRGARWDAGSYRVRYRVMRCDCDPYVAVTATRGRKSVRFQIGTV